MAHIDKCQREAVGQILAHVQRGNERFKRDFDFNIKDRTYSNENIKRELSNQNYSLHERGDNLTDYQYIKQRVKEYNALNRKGVNWIGTIVTTLPEKLKDGTKEEQELFFKSSLEFLKERYGNDNIVYAYVHVDETTPHMHVGVTPCGYDEKRGRKYCSFKQFFPRTEYRSFHKDYKKHLENVFGYDVGVYNDTNNTKAPNKTIKELIRESNQMDKELDAKTEEIDVLGSRIDVVSTQLEMKESELESVKDDVKKKIDEVNELTQIVKSREKEVIELSRLKGDLEHENVNLKHENRFLKEQWDNLGVLEKKGLKPIKIASETIQMEVFKREQEYREIFRKGNAELREEIEKIKRENAKLRADNKELRSDIVIYEDNFQRLRKENKHIKNEFKEFAKAVFKLAPKIFKKAILEVSRSAKEWLERNILGGNKIDNEREEERPKRSYDGYER